MVKPRLGFHIAPAFLDTHRQARGQVHAGAGGVVAGVLVGAVEGGDVAEPQAAHRAQQLRVTGKLQLRQAAVGQLVVRQGRVNGLPGLHPRQRPPVATEIARLAQPWQMRSRTHLQAGIQVLEIEVVGHVVHVGGERPAAHRAVMAPGRQFPVLAVEFAVVEQYAVAELAPAQLGEITEFALQAAAPPADKAWRDGGVHLRMDVDIDRLSEVRAAAVAGGDGGKQQTGFASLIDREGDPGQPDQRHALDAQGDVAGLAPALFPIQPDLPAAQFPAVGAGRAGGVGPLLNGGEVFHQINVLRGAPGAGTEQRVADPVEAGLAALGLAAHAVGDEGELVGFQAQAVGHLELAAGLVEQRGLGGQTPAGALDQHLAVHIDQPVLGKAGAVGGDDDVALIRRHTHGRVVIDAAAPDRNRPLLHRRQARHSVAVDPIEVVVGSGDAGQQKGEAG